MVNLTDEAQDPVDLLFGTQLSDETYTNRALAYCQGLVQQPQETIICHVASWIRDTSFEEHSRDLTYLSGQEANVP